MDTNKMRDISREQFEAWYLEKHCGGPGRVKTCSNDLNTYYYTDTQTKWVAWQASRAAVVVEIEQIRSEAKRQEDGLKEMLRRQNKQICALRGKP